MTNRETETRFDQILNGFTQQIAAQAADCFLERASYLPSDEGTPIERLVGIALLYALESNEWFAGEGWGDQWPCVAIKAKDALSFVPTCEMASIWFQAPVGKYKADFLLCVGHHHGGYVWGAIECDGHDHHNITKEQARRDRERDRFFQSKGIIILRYTGSEIHASPLKVAVDAITLLNNRAAEPTALRWGVSNG